MNEFNLIEVPESKFEGVEFDNNKVREIKESLRNDISRKQVLKQLSEEMGGINNVTLEKTKSGELDEVSLALKSVINDIKGINPNTLLLSTSDKKGIFKKIFGNKIVDKVSEMLEKFETVEGMFDNLMGTIVQCKSTLERDDLQNTSFLEEINKMGRQVYYYIKAVEELETEKIQEINKSIDEFTVKSAQNQNDFALAPLRENIYKEQDLLKQLSNTKVSLYTQVMLHYNNGNILRELRKSNSILSEQLETIVIYDIPNIKQQMALCISMLRQKNALTIIEKVNDMFNNMVTVNANMLSENLIDLQRMNDSDAKKIEIVMKAFHTINETHKKIDEMERKSRERNKSIVDKCIQNINDFNNSSIKSAEKTVDSFTAQNTTKSINSISF